MKWLDDALQWYPEKGCGYYPVKQTPYDDAYFDKYAGYATTKLGHDLNAARVAFAEKHTTGQLVDIGIGCGQFVLSYGCKGYDVNPVGIAWLQDCGYWCDPYEQVVDSASFWDSFEHIADPSILLANIRQSVVMTIPIFMDADHVLQSKHYRHDEHYWYFTHNGLIAYMKASGFALMEWNTMESDIGREDVNTYAFRR